jgi:hypothetical protein
MNSSLDTYTAAKMYAPTRTAEMRHMSTGKKPQGGKNHSAAAKFCRRVCSWRLVSRSLPDMHPAGCWIAFNLSTLYPSGRRLAGAMCEVKN